MNPRTTTPTRRKRLIVAGAVAAGLSVAGTTAAMASSRTDAPAPTEASAAAAPAEAAPAPAPGTEAELTDEERRAAPEEWAQAPAGYTEEQADALWSSGLTADDIAALGALWQVDGFELKARIGQAILDGEQLPVTPGSTPQAAPGAQYSAFWGAGYTDQDLEALNALWSTDWAETKLRAGQAILDGQALPIPPSGTPAAS